MGRVLLCIQLTTAGTNIQPLLQAIEISLYGRSSGLGVIEKVSFYLFCFRTEGNIFVPRLLHTQFDFSIKFEQTKSREFFYSSKMLFKINVLLRSKQFWNFNVTHFTNTARCIC